MQSSTISAPAERSLHARHRRFSASTVLALLGLAALWLVLCRHLSSEWSLNEQYSYGWFVPFFAGSLFWLRWHDRPVTKPVTRSSRSLLAIAICAIALLLLLPIRLFEIGNPDWRPLSWLHAGVVVGFTLALLWRTGGTAWLKHFAFPVAFIFVAVPWVTPIEQPVVQGLMRTVALIGSEVITLFGIPAQLEGNTIRVASGVVGVNEACSGVRSLQTSIMIALLLGELKRFSFAKRCLLLGAAVSIAFLANCGRALFLVWVASTRGVSSVAAWHDFAGYSIVTVVFVASLGAAAWLGRGGSSAEKTTSGRPSSDEPPSRAADASPLTGIPHAVTASIVCLVWMTGVEVAVETWYRVHERQFAQAEPWTVRWPAIANGFRRLPIDHQVQAMLLCDEADQASWIQTVPRSEPEQNGALRYIGYFFRWNPGGTSVVRARAHRPDVCLPSAGWRQIEDAGLRNYSTGGELRLPFRHFRFRKEQEPVTADTFFCIYEDRLVGWDELASYNPDEQTSYTARFQTVRNGIRNMGQQVMQVIVLSDGKTTMEATEKGFAELLPQLVMTNSEQRPAGAPAAQ